MDAVRPVGTFFADGFHYGSVRKQNEQLQYTIGQLREQASETQFEMQQLRLLRRLQNLPFVHNPTVIAETTDESSNEFVATITVDKGSSDGVMQGFAVVCHSGLVGQVVRVSKHSSIVRLMTDGQSKVGVAFGTSQQYGAVVNGEGPGDKLNANFVGTSVPIRVGEQMVTTPLQSASLPPDIPVGTVSHIRIPPGASQRSIAVKPTANLDELFYVAIVQWAPSPAG